MAVPELINACLYIVALLVYWLKAKDIDTFFVLMAAYAFTAVMNLLYLNSGASSYHHTTVLPYIYMFVCFLICFKPYQGMTIGKSLYIKETPLIKILTWIYIVTGILSIYYTIPDAVMIMTMGDYGELRNQMYNDAESVQLYNSQFERLCKNISSYTSPFCIVMAFYQLSKPEKKWYIIILLFGIWLVSTFLSSVLVASRGMVANLILRVVLILFIFKESISAKVKRVFVVTLGILCVPSFIYMMAVSVSRFGESEATGSIFMYLGHSMLNFNQSVMGSMHSFAWGRKAFSFFGGFLGWEPLDTHSLGYTGGTGFYTYLGTFYIDFGPVFTFLLCIFLCKLISKHIHNKSKSFSDLIVIVYFASFFMNGVFVIGSYGLQWIMVWVVYRIVKFSEK